MSKKEFSNLPVRTQNLYNMLNNLIVTLCALNNDEIKTAAASSAGLHGVSDFKKLKGKMMEKYLIEEFNNCIASS